MHWRHLCILFFIVTLRGSTVVSADVAPAEPRPAPAEPIDVKAAPATRPTDFAYALPKELWPTKAGWDAVAGPKAHDWLHKNTVGTGYHFTLPLAAVTVHRVPSKADPLQAEGWLLVLTMDRTATTYGEVTIHAVVGTYVIVGAAADFVASPAAKELARGEAEAHIKLIVSEEVAKAAKLWAKGDPVTLRGTLGYVVLPFGNMRPHEPTTLYLIPRTCELLSVGKWNAPQR